MSLTDEKIIERIRRGTCDGYYTNQISLLLSDRSKLIAVVQIAEMAFTKLEKCPLKWVKDECRKILPLLRQNK